MSKYISYSLLGVIAVLLGIITYLKMSNESLRKDLTTMNIKFLNDEQEIKQLNSIIDNQNIKIKDLHLKEAEAMRQYEEWLVKEDKYKKEIKDILNIKDSNVCETLKKKLEAIAKIPYEEL